VVLVAEHHFGGEGCRQTTLLQLVLIYQNHALAGGAADRLIARISTQALIYS